MYRILFDLFQCQPVDSSKYHGGGEYIKVVFKRLIELYSNSIKLVVFYNPEKFLDDWIKDIITKEKIKTYAVEDCSGIRKIFQHEEIDIFYSGLPYYYKKADIPGSVLVIGTIHGLRFLELPADKYACKYYSGARKIKEVIRFVARNFYKEKKKEDFKNCIELLDKVVCVSNHTMYTIRNYYPNLENKKISVFYTPQKVAESSLSKQSPVDTNYILLMGGDRWVKNCYRAIIAIETLLMKGYLDNYRIVIVGGLSSSITRRIKDNERYIMKDYVSTEELETLYKFCDVFLYPSLNEGFGMPPLEAMKYGRTCIVSGVCSLPEICGDAVYYVNPYDIGEISGRILNAVDEKKPSTQVIEQYRRINEKQNRDLDELCRLIKEYRRNTNYD